MFGQTIFLLLTISALVSGTDYRFVHRNGSVLIVHVQNETESHAQNEAVDFADADKKKTVLIMLYLSLAMVLGIAGGIGFANRLKRSNDRRRVALENKN